MDKQKYLWEVKNRIRFEYNTVPILTALKVEEKRIQKLYKGEVSCKLRDRVNFFKRAELHGRMEGIRFAMGLIHGE